ncbi:unnamed protein product, partial [marine sediment metagenome]
NEYQLVLGKGLYLLDNNIGIFFEKKLIMKMIPSQLIDQVRKSDTTTTKSRGDADKIIRNCYDTTESIRETARLLDISLDRVRRVIRRGDRSDVCQE